MVLITDASIDARLADCDLKITNAWEDPKISGPILAFGFDQPRFDIGFALYKAAFDSHQFKKDEFTEQLAATEAFQVAFDETDKIFMQDVAVARVAIKDNLPLLKRLGLIGERKITYTGWLGHAKSFYGTVLGNEEAAALMANYGRTPEILQANKDKVLNVEKLKKIQLREVGDAQEATKKRDEALEALEAWVADLVAIARVALADSPQLLEKLNIKVSP